MAMQTFNVVMRTVVNVTLDDSLLPDDEWRSTFYHLVTLGQVAEHVAYNAAANGVNDITRLDGFADRDKSLCKISVGEWESELE